MIFKHGRILLNMRVCLIWRRIAPLSDLRGVPLGSALLEILRGLQDLLDKRLRFHFFLTLPAIIHLVQLAHDIFLMRTLYHFEQFQHFLRRSSRFLSLLNITRVFRQRNNFAPSLSMKGLILRWGYWLCEIKCRQIILIEMLFFLLIRSGLILAELILQ